MLIGNRTVNDLTYMDLQQIATDWIAVIEALPERVTPLPSGVSLEDHEESSVAVSISDQAQDTARAARILQRRHFGHFYRFVRPRSPFERGLLELFLMARLHPYVVSYLSLQEGRDWEGGGCEFTHTSKLITQSLITMGKSQLLSIRLRLYFLRFRINLDPVQELRSLYVALLGQRRTNQGAGLSEIVRLRGDLLLFRWKAWLLRGLLRCFIGKVQNRISEAHLRRVFQGRSFRRNVTLFLLILFPGAKRLSEPQWRELFAQMEEYFVPRAFTFGAVLPDESVRNHGIIKLMKIAFGVIAGRLAERDRHEADEQKFIFDTLRLAYSWGITYPLVDNILDSDMIAPEIRRSLTHALRQLFAEEPSSAATPSEDPLVREAVERLAEVITLVPVGQRPQARKTLHFLLEAHQRDSERRLASAGVRLNKELEREVWADSVLKAALIRLATMEVCGTVIDQGRLADQLRSSLINQLGDDLWDIYEDLDDDRITPFTAFLTGHSRRNPFRFFLRYCLATLTAEPEKRRIAMIIGLQETARCLLESTKERGQDPLGVTQHVEEFLAELDGSFSIQSIEYVPHVDPDSVLFELEKSLLY